MYNVAQVNTLWHRRIQRYIRIYNTVQYLGDTLLDLELNPRGATGSLSSLLLSSLELSDTQVYAS